MAVTAHPRPTLVTAEQLLEMRVDLGRLELWEGEVVHVSPTGGPHALIGARLMKALDAAAQRHRVGQMWSQELGYKIDRDPDVVVGPDLALVEVAYLVDVSIDGRGYHEYRPPLVVEVASPTDREGAIEEKLALYLRHGVPEVWWVRPAKRTVTKYRVDAEPVELREGDVLDGGDILPGLALPVARLFVPPTLEW